MQVTPQAENEIHRVILFPPRGVELLVLSEHGRHRLPALSIPSYQRIAEHLTASVHREYSQNAVSLFGFSASSTHYQVMESTEAFRCAIADTRWVPVSSLDESQFDDPADVTAIARAVAECKEYADGPNHGSFGQLGWFTELTEWIRDAIRPAGLILNGRFQQLNASPTFSLIRFETSGPAIWFKAVGQPNLREYPITLALAKHFSGFVPRVIADRHDCNGWLAIEAEGNHPDEHAHLAVWMRVATTLAEMQIASFGQTLHLLDRGCRDARVAALLELVEPFFEVMVELMERQTKESPPPLSRSQLLGLQTQLQDTLSEAANSGIPNTIGHLDFNPGNVVVKQAGCVFLDWAEACAGLPFLTFQYLLEHLRRLWHEDDSWESAITSTYLDRWQSFVSPHEIAKALRVSPLLAVFAYAVCGDAWRDLVCGSRPESARHFRSLTRRMKHEADLLIASEINRRVPCLS
jgi:hypothetical protein